MIMDFISNIDWHWWWFIAGVAMILAEFSVPGLYICFFGVGALFTGVVVWIFPHLPFAVEVLLFSVLSVLFLLGCRRLMPDVFRGSMKVDPSDIENDDVMGAEVVVVEAIAPGKPGKVEFRGSVWTASADRVLTVGERAKIARRQNITLYLD